LVVLVFQKTSTNKFPEQQKSVRCRTKLAIGTVVKSPKTVIGTVVKPPKPAIGTVVKTLESPIGTVVNPPKSSIGTDGHEPRIASQLLLQFSIRSNPAASRVQPPWEKLAIGRAAPKSWLPTCAGYSAASAPSD
jgi:hypothetical protein